MNKLLMAQIDYLGNNYQTFVCMQKFKYIINAELENKSMSNSTAHSFFFNHIACLLLWFRT